MDSVADVLDRAADLLTPEGAWTQGAFARDASGGSLTSSRDERAVCWCMFGAIIKTGDGQHVNAIGDLLDNVLYDQGYLSWNDALGRTQAEVVAALRTAARQSRQGNDRGGA